MNIFGILFVIAIIGVMFWGGCYIIVDTQKLFRRSRHGTVIKDENDIDFRSMNWASVEIIHDLAEQEMERRRRNNE